MRRRGPTRCHEKTYAPKRRLGLIAGAGMPDEIEIDGNEVEGLVVVGRVLAGGHGAGGSWSESEAVSVTQPRSRHPCAAPRPSLRSKTA